MPRERWVQFTKWLPYHETVGKGVVYHYRDFNEWISWFKKTGKKYQIRTKGKKKALFVERA